jgi:hypothetical protein
VGLLNLKALAPFVRRWISRKITSSKLVGGADEGQILAARVPIQVDIGQDPDANLALYSLNNPNPKASAGIVFAQILGKISPLTSKHVWPASWYSHPQSGNQPPPSVVMRTVSYGGDYQTALNPFFVVISLPDLTELISVGPQSFIYLVSVE